MRCPEYTVAGIYPVYVYTQSKNKKNGKNIAKLFFTAYHDKVLMAYFMNPDDIIKAAEREVSLLELFKYVGAFSSLVGASQAKP